MTRNTIDYGIDLGTTNSAIAVMDGVEPMIIKNNKSQDITPSAVGYTKAGVLRLGDAAKNLQLSNPNDAFRGFKRFMGSDRIFEFASTRKRMKPEELSAEVLKSLKGDVEQARGEIVESAIITIPAAFELHQCEATRRAAELAGFAVSPLLLEPVAAALAYGFQRDEEKAYWLVYDFGGGTFDAALIRAEQGIITVVAHEGDNFLGGEDIDTKIMQDLVLPSLTKDFDLPDFRKGNKRWEKEVFKLLSAIEQAKIETSRCASAPLVGCCFEDAAGREIDVEAISLQLTQQDVARIAEPIIAKSVALVKKVLAAKNLRATDLNKAILVGGPTQAPYFRAQLQAELGAPVDYSVDPMTVVARGAAVFASTQSIGRKAATPTRAGEYSLDLEYKPTGIEPEPLVGGRVLGSAGGRFDGFTIEFRNEKAGWSSGQAPIHADGTFTVTLSAERKTRNQYRITLRNKQGQVQKLTPDDMHYTIGMDGVEQPIIHSIAVGRGVNEVKVYFDKGSGLPQKKSITFHTAHAVKPGKADSMVRIPVVEGESPLCDRNRLVGFLDISGDKIRRELPEGQEIEVALSIDDSRKIKVTAFVPFLDEEFEQELDLGRKAAANDAHVLKQRLENEKKRLESLKDQADQSEERGAGKVLKEIDDEGALKELRSKVRDAEGDFVAGEQCDKMLLQLACRMDDVENILKWPALVAEVRDMDQDLRSLAKDRGKPNDREKADDLHELAEEQIAAKRAEALKQTQDRMLDLYRSILWEMPSFWAGYFRNLERDEPLMPDASRAKHLLDHGRKAITENNLPGLRNACLQLAQLLPRQAAEEAQRGWKAGVI